MKHGLVLGGGGLVGMGYHAGALKALEDFGLDVASSDVMVGTSAGAVMAAYLAAGWTPTDFYEYGMGRHPRTSSDPARQRAEVREIFVPLWSTRAERLRRSLGSFFAVAASRGYWRVGGGRPPVARLRRAFPAGLYSTDATRQRFHEELPARWPGREIYLCAADLYTGRRVAFGAPGTPRVPFPDAVLASTAIPGVFPPVKLDGRYYVDGGVVSATSLDLATEAGCDTILCVAPLGYRHEGAIPLSEPLMWTPVLLRAMFARALRREVRAARAAGIDVLVIRPWLEELRAHGANSMRHYDRASVIESARAGTLRLLEDNADHPAVAALATGATGGAASGA